MNEGNKRRPGFEPDIGTEPLIRLLKRLRAEQFYGVVELKFQGGLLQLTNITTSLKPNALVAQAGNQHDDDARFNR